ncbi:G-protein coupled receptor 35-like [Narcine bancroftii]|uniref:G-protein coupled receptor 35-like n=1 Tax=Narcine bancroftii TaxID=1343680 RepID=UPI003831DE5A
MNCTRKISESIKTFQTVVFTLVFIIGIILTATAFQAFYCKLRKWTETTIYMTNLAVSDLAVLIALPFKIYSYHSKLTREFLCKFILMFSNLNMCISLITIMYNNVDRYIAIQYPFKAKLLRSPMKAAMACVGAWIFAGLWIIPLQLIPFMSNKTNSFNKDPSTPCFVADKDNYLIFLLTSVVFLVIPLITVMFCSIQILQKLWKRPISNSSEISTRRSVQIIAASTIILIFCFMPFNTAVIIHLVAIAMNINCTTQNQIYLFLKVAECIMTINCCLDGFFFYFISADTVKFYQNQREVNDCNKDQTSMLPA